MRFEEENIEGMMRDYLEEIISDFTRDVKKIFFCISKSKYADYSIFTDEVLQVFFERSDFQKLLKEDTSYVMDRYPEYWAYHIINEIDKIVDFRALQLKEEEKFKNVCNESLKYLEIHDGNKINLVINYLDEKDIQFKYVKHKKKFIEAIGLQAANSLNFLKEFIVKFRENDCSQQIAGIRLETIIEKYENSYKSSSEEGYSFDSLQQRENNCKLLTY